MPIYTYECDTCEAEYEQMRKIDDRDKLMICTYCQRPVERKVDRPGLVWAPTVGGMR
jgi:putative FmdB family regulatory protein